MDCVVPCHWLLEPQPYQHTTWLARWSLIWSPNLSICSNYAFRGGSESNGFAPSRSLMVYSPSSFPKPVKRLGNCWMGSSSLEHHHPVAPIWMQVVRVRICVGPWPQISPVQAFDHRSIFPWAVPLPEWCSYLELWMRWKWGAISCTCSGIIVVSVPMSIWNSISESFNSIVTLQELYFPEPTAPS